MFLESSFPRAGSGPELMLSWDLSWPEGTQPHSRGADPGNFLSLHPAGLKREETLSVVTAWSFELQLESVLFVLNRARRDPWALARARGRLLCDFSFILCPP